MKQVRRSVFETNSSSVHSISIIKSVDRYSIPKQIKFDNDCEFGWEVETYRDTNSKANYLMSGIACSAKDQETLNRNVKLLFDALDSWDVKHDTPTFEYRTWGDGERGWFSFGSVDHGGELDDFVETVLNDRNLLCNFLFDIDSIIETGNDNEDCDRPESLHENDPNYYVYVKGN